jgi:hypothetical protein
MISQDMVLSGLDHHPLTATAAVVWNGDLPRPLQQILFDAADGIAPAGPRSRPASTSPQPSVKGHGYRPLPFCVVLARSLEHHMTAADPDLRCTWAVPGL